jgi:hypothetical protein
MAMKNRARGSSTVPDQSLRRKPVFSMAELDGTESFKHSWRRKYKEGREVLSKV